MSTPSISDLEYAFLASEMGYDPALATPSLAVLRSQFYGQGGLRANYQKNDTMTSGQNTIPRYAATTSVTTATQLALITYFNSIKTETVNNLYTITGGTAAAATPSLCRIGLYSVNTSTGLLTLIGSTPNDTTLFAATFTRYLKAMSAGVAIKAGLRYAKVDLVVTAVATPSFYGSYGVESAEMGRSPRLAGALSGQADLPATIAEASITNLNALVYGGITP
jgi:hypothetical protein